MGIVQRATRGLLWLMGHRADTDEIVDVRGEQILYKERIDSGVRLFPPPGHLILGDEIDLAGASIIVGTTPERLLELARSRKLKTRELIPGVESTVRFLRSEIEMLKQARTNVAPVRVEPSVPTSTRPTQLGEQNGHPDQVGQVDHSMHRVRNRRVDALGGCHVVDQAPRRVG